MRVVSIVLVFILLVCCTQHADARTWTSSGGGFKIEAEFVKLVGNQLTLRKSDGAELVVPLEKLSQTDQDVARRYARPAPVDISAIEKKVKTALRNGDVNGARGALSALANVNHPRVSTVARLVSDVSYLWGRFDSSATRLRATSTLQLARQDSNVVSASFPNLTLHVASRNYKFNLSEKETLPSTLVVAIANYRGATKQSYLDAYASLVPDTENTAKWKGALQVLPNHEEVGSFVPPDTSAVGSDDPEKPPVEIPNGSDTPPTVPRKDLLPVPNGAELAAKRSEILDIFKDDIKNAGRDATKQHALALAFFTTGSETIASDPAAGYILLVESVAYLARLGNVDDAMKVIEKIDTSYQPDGRVALKAKLLVAASVIPKAPQKNQDLVDLCKRFMVEAAAEADVKSIDEFTKAATAALRMLRDNLQKKELLELAKNLKAELVQYGNIATARQTLETTPDDPDANLAVGKFLCFIKGDWEAGVKHLAKGSNADLAAVAKLELTNPSDAIGQRELGKKWHTVMTSDSHQTNAPKVAGRVLHWYEKVLPSLKGLEKVRAVQIISEAKELRGDDATANTKDEVKVAITSLPYKAEGLYSSSMKRQVKMGGKTYTDGISSKPDSEDGNTAITFALNKQYTTITGRVGFDDDGYYGGSSSNRRTGAQFYILVNNKRVWSSNPMAKGSYQDFRVLVKNAQTVTLWTATKGYYYYNNTCWGDVKVVKK